MLNERQLKIVDLLSNSRARPRAGATDCVSGRTILRDIDYLNFTFNGKARIFSGSAGYQLEIFERRSFSVAAKHDNDDHCWRYYY